MVDFGRLLCTITNDDQQHFFTSFEKHCPSNINHLNKYKRNVLMEYIMMSHKIDSQTVKQLVKAGIDLGQTDLNGYTALFCLSLK